jgi:hypothetical protein
MSNKRGKYLVKYKVNTSGYGTNMLILEGGTESEAVSMLRQRYSLHKENIVILSMSMESPW